MTLRPGSSSSGHSQRADGENIIQAINAVVSVSGSRLQPLFTRHIHAELPLGASASRLLTAANAVVDFVDRDELALDMEAWVDSESQLAVRVIGGAGGSGKTRLAVELLRRLDVRGHGLAGDADPAQWFGGFLDEEAGAEIMASIAALPLPRLLVLDYAEARTMQIARLLEILTTQGAPYPLRLLLLVRHPYASSLGMVGDESSWITAVRPIASRVLANQVLDTATLTIMDEHPLELGARWALLAQARRDFAIVEAAGQRPAPLPPADLSADLYAQPLTIIMAGYLLARGSDPSALPSTRHRMFEAILSHECEYWRRRAIDEGLELTPLELRALVGVGTLVDPKDSDESARFLALLSFVGGKLLTRADSFLRNVYPNGLAEGRWAPVRPDRLGEYIVSNTLKSNAVLLGSALDPSRDADRLLKTLDILTRACADDAELAEITAIALMTRLPELVSKAFLLSNDPNDYGSRAVQLPGHLAALLQRVGSLVEGKTLIHALENLPNGHWPTASLGLALSIGLISNARIKALEGQDEQLHAWSLTEYASRLADAGELQESLVAAEEAVNTYRRLEEANPVFRKSLATSLIALAGRLAAVGRRKPAVAVASEAAELCRELADPARGGSLSSVPYLAMALDTLANRLAGLGRQEEALLISEEAIALYRELADPVGGDPVAHVPDFARALMNHANRLTECGLHGRSLPTSEEVVALYRFLAAAKPGSYTVGLASSLDGHATRLAAVGRSEEAFFHSAEALDLRRTLAKGNPKAFTPYLAATLGNHANRLAEIGSYKEAAAISADAVALNRELVNSGNGDPSAYTPQLAASLASRVPILVFNHRSAEALAPAMEAVDYNRALATASPAAHRPNLALSLLNLAQLLGELGRDGEALAPSKESLAIYRALVKSNSVAHTPDLAAALNNRAILLASVGRHEDAMSLSDEAVSIRRALAKTSPTAHNDGLAKSLTNHAIRLIQAERPVEALALFEEVVELYSALSERNPIGYARDLALALRNRTRLLSDLDDAGGG